VIHEVQTELTLRPAAPGDAPTLVGMNRQLIEDQRHDNPASADQLHRRMAAWIDGRYNYQVRVFELGGRIAAYAVAREDDDALLHNQRALDFWRALGFRDYSLVLRKRGT
jgi:hypothetical protein